MRVLLNRFSISPFHCSTIFLLLLSSPLWAGKRFQTTGQAGYPILKVPMSARAVGLGEAFVGGTNDAAAMEYNPAALTTMKRMHLSALHMMYFGESSLSGFSLGSRWGGNGWGIHYRQFSADDEARDVQGTKSGDITHADTVLALAYARRFGKRFSTGIEFKQVTREIQKSSILAGEEGVSVDNSVMALDLGLLWKLPRKATLGVSLQNIGSGAAFQYSGPKDSAVNPYNDKTQGATEALPLQLRFGGVFPLGSINYSWEVLQPKDNRAAAASGVEGFLTPSFVLRGGLRYQRYLDISMGFGVETRFLSFDYSFSPRIDLGTAHRVSLGMRF